MPIVQTLRGMLPVQIEFVGKDAKEIKRSVKGSLHLTPGRTKVVTDDELDYIEKNEKEIFSKLHIVPGTRAVKKTKAEKVFVSTPTIPKIEKGDKKNKPEKVKKSSGG